MTTRLTRNAKGTDGTACAVTLALSVSLLSRHRGTSKLYNRRTLRSALISCFSTLLHERSDNALCAQHKSESACRTATGGCTADVWRALNVSLADVAGSPEGARLAASARAQPVVIVARCLHTTEARSGCSMPRTARTSAEAPSRQFGRTTRWKSKPSTGVQVRLGCVKQLTGKYRAAHH